MARFKRNYLPSQSRPWAKQLEDAIDSSERSFKTLDVNNRSKDEQFSASLSRLDGAVLDARAASELADSAQDAAIAANTLATTANGNAIAANSAASSANSLAIQANADATEAINKVVGFSTSGGSTINADNISGGTISGDFINGGTISGNIISGGTISGITISASTFVSGGVVDCAEINTANIYANQTIEANGGYLGNINTTIANSTTSSFAGNVFINTSGSMFRSTSTSSREAKENILSYEFDTDAFIGVNPVTFNYKLDAVQSQEETEINQLGFILEDFEDAGVGEHLVIPANEVDQYKGLRYDKLYMMLHKVVQAQDETIKNLTARIEALESN
jgi:hypothetical protein